MQSSVLVSLATHNLLKLSMSSFQKEFLEKEMEKRVIRTNTLGKDRDYNRYWFFRRDGRVFIESSDSSQWGYYNSKEEVLSVINLRNLRSVMLVLFSDFRTTDLCCSLMH